MVDEFYFTKLNGFDWDEGNKEKNWAKHKVDYKESEEIFFNKPLLIDEDVKHSFKEKRFEALGQTNKGRGLFVAFTIRNNKIRIISARDQDGKERKKYEN